MSLAATSLLLAIFLCTCLLLYREGFMNSARSIVFTVFFLTAAFALRILLLEHRTGDFNMFLQPWTEHFRENGGFKALKDTIGNYNLPYLYFLALFSYLPIDELYLIKYLSICFDVILAWGASRIVLFYTASKRRQLCAFMAVMLLPTVMLNGACWGQCDSIFAAFCVLAFYYGIANRGRLSLAFAALALSFKVQAVFFLPVYGAFLLTERIRFKDLWVFPAVYIATLLPAVLLGHPIADALTVYFRQVDGGTGSLNYNSASVYALIPYGYDAEWLSYASYIGIALALALVYTSMLWPVARIRSVTNSTLLGLTVLLTLGIPLFLPHMHDRYFYLADIFTLVLAFVSPMCAGTALLCQFASLLGYHAYLMERFLLTMNYGAWALLAAFVIICVYIHKSFRFPENTR
ncbi:MAG: conjugal transfer protein TraL [Candidatus Heteroscillospira sp.]|jgi:Gpi18-like mannosyltransferase